MPALFVVGALLSAVQPLAIAQPAEDRTQSATEARNLYGVSVSAPDIPDPDTFGEKYVTRPSRDAVMGFSFPTDVTELLVKGDQFVKKGELLLRARDLEVLASLDLTRVQANSDEDVKRAQSALELAEIEFKSFETAREGGAGSPQEFDRAKNALETRRIELTIAQINLDLRQIQLRAKEAEADRYRLVAPFDGKVDAVLVDIGQAIKESEPAVRVVDIDPLWIDVPTPTLQTLEQGLKKGDPAWVVVELTKDYRVYPARVIEVSSVADSSSGTRRVRVELRNPKAWPAGLTAWVRFTEPAGAWAGRVVPDWPVGGKGDAGDEGVLGEGAAGVTGDGATVSSTGDAR